MSMDDKRGAWKSRTGFLLAIIGSAIGLGNIWRFPYMAYKNGGGAFLIPYVVALLSIGIPLMIAEIAVGHKFRASAPLAFKRIGRRWELLGWWIIAFLFVGIQMYYCVVIAWCINYFIYSFNLAWGADTNSFFMNSFLRITSGPFSLGGFNVSILLSLAFVWLVNWWVVGRGIRKGIEVTTKILMPLLFLIITILVVWSVTLPGASEGIAAYLWPDFSKLMNPSIWSDAFSQIFFTLSLGMGINIAYASYLPAKTDIKSNTLITCITNCSFSLFAGFAVFSVIGYMSMVSGKPLSEVVSAGPGLAFVTYPAAINLLPMGNVLFAVLFFLALIFAGITSSVAIFESAASSVIDKFGWKRKKVATVMALVGFFGGIIFTTGAGLYWLDLIDYVLNHFCLMAVGVLEAVAIGWVYKAVKVRNHVRVSVGRSEDQSGSIMGKIWTYLIIVWIPLVLGFLIVIEIIIQLQNPYGGYEWLFIVSAGCGWIVMTLLLAKYLAVKAWKTPPVKENEQI